MLSKQNLLAYNFFLDLQRAATSFYLNPQGKTHQVFLNHAQKTLRNFKSKNGKIFSDKLFQIIKNVNYANEKNRQYLADQILTLGILLKPTT